MATARAKELRYLDISDPAGAIIERGSVIVDRLGAERGPITDAGNLALRTASWPRGWANLPTGRHQQPKRLGHLAADFTDPISPRCREPADAHAG